MGALLDDDDDDDDDIVRRRRFASRESPHPFQFNKRLLTYVRALSV